MRRILSREEIEAAVVEPEVEPVGRQITTTLIPQLSNREISNQPVPPGHLLLCRYRDFLTESLERFNGPLQTTYSFYLEAQETEILLMTAEKQQFGMDAKYIIKTLDKDKEFIMGKVKTNLLGTTLTLHKFLGGLDYQEVASIACTLFVSHDV